MVHAANAIHVTVPSRDYAACFAQASLWPSVPLLVPQNSVGLAYGLLTSLQMISIGSCNFIIADLRNGAKKCPVCYNVSRVRLRKLHIRTKSYCCSCSDTERVVLPRRFQVDNNQDCADNMASWDTVMTFLMVNMGICALFGLALNLLDCTQGGLLNASRRVSGECYAKPPRADEPKVKCRRRSKSYGGTNKRTALKHCNAERTDISALGLPSLSLD